MRNNKIHQLAIAVIIALVLGVLVFGTEKTAESSMVTVPVSAEPLTPLENIDASIAVTSDLHIQAADNGLSAVGIEQLHYSGEITQAFGEEMTLARPDAVVLLGDLSGVGRVNEHQTVVEILEKMSNEGLRVLVVPGNHDLNDINREEFVEIYGDFGFSDALSHDEISCSYVSAVTDKVWALMLDTNIFENTEMKYEAELPNSTLNWIESVLKDAEAQGITVISFSHQNVVDLIFDQNPASTVKGSDRLAGLFNQYGVRLNVAGHRHSYHVGKGQGEGFYEVLEPMLASYPHAYGWITVDTSTSQINYESKTVDVDAWAKKEGINSEILLNFTDNSKEWSELNTLNTIDSIVDNLDLAEKERETIREFLLQLMSAASDGSLASRRAEFTESEGYSLWKEYGTKSNYYFWFEKMLKPSTDTPEGDFSIR